MSKEIFDNQVVAEVKLFLRAGEEWFCKGSQTGQMQIIKKNVGDAMKGAITDALQKCLSLLSIGSDAYRGLLRKVYLGQSGDTPVVHQRRSQPKQTGPTPLPKNSQQPKAIEQTVDNNE